MQPQCVWWFTTEDKQCAEPAKTNTILCDKHLTTTSKYSRASNPGVRAYWRPDPQYPLKNAPQ